ncbi:Type II inositol 1,4,5-trisphosphate 5-phosphatase [Smittium mucronatum]|uniref:Type II inositol 1,4,5-trisphosphate 5-phosphatase n=1 Tax=Smittium mucronatum TaxID=133383 RepID=A0A1R0GYY2_9FUNG|nr:Type II inositol 1,4,5-trisphosphate 5-phosphatase [Smittium mucronatum]
MDEDISEFDLNPFSREKWIDERVLMRDHEYISCSDLNLFIGTWNVNGKPPPESVSDWFPFRKTNLNSTENQDKTPTENDEFDPDVIVIGFQELDDNPSSYIYATDLKEKEWEDAIYKSLNADQINYYKVASKQLVGMLIFIFIKPIVAERIKSISSCSLGLGALGILGNKGAVGIRIQIDDTPIVFINSHLIHDEINFSRRNEQFHEISERFEFNDFDPNFSKDENELYISKRRGLAFNGFKESEINFNPTYKFVIGTNEYSEKRTQSWTDRILWWTNKKYPSEYVSNINYLSQQNLAISDHKPVSATFKIKLIKIDKESQKKTVISVLKELDAVENELIPIAGISNHSLDFGMVEYQTGYNKTISILNNGNV